MARIPIKRKADPETFVSLSQERGAPTKYKEKYCKEILEYFSSKPYEKIAGRNEAGDYPSLAGFAIQIGVSQRSFHNWAKEYPEFYEALMLAKDYQENWLLVNGLKNTVPPQFAQFVLINHSDFRAKAKDEAPDTVVNNVGLDVNDPEFEKKWLERKAELEKKLGLK